MFVNWNKLIPWMPLGWSKKVFFCQIWSNYQECLCDESSFDPTSAPETACCLDFMLSFCILFYFSNCCSDEKKLDTGGCFFLNFFTSNFMQIYDTKDIVVSPLNQETITPVFLTSQYVSASLSQLALAVSVAHLVTFVLGLLSTFTITVVLHWVNWVGIREL